MTGWEAVVPQKIALFFLVFLVIKTIREENCLPYLALKYRKQSLCHCGLFHPIIYMAAIALLTGFSIIKKIWYRMHRYACWMMEPVPSLCRQCRDNLPTYSMANFEYITWGMGWQCHDSSLILLCLHSIQGCSIRNSFLNRFISWGEAKFTGVHHKGAGLTGPPLWNWFI